MAGSALRRLGTGAAGISGLVAVAALLAMNGSASAAAHGAERRCRAPRLVGLTVEAARRRAAHAHCMLRLEGAHLERAAVQKVERQFPAKGRRASTVTIWLEPFCFGSAAYGPSLKEPLLTPGPTKLVSGFYLDGGPAAPFSAPRCQRPEPKPDAGTVEVLDSRGAVVATQTSAQGHFVEIPLAPGTYTIRGTFLGPSTTCIPSAPSHSSYRRARPCARTSRCRFPDSGAPRAAVIPLPLRAPS